jgi:antitoxin component YwqK of YwqJK toxin-antitoxin module
MKKFFKILRKIIKILLIFLLWILIFLIIIIAIFNDKKFKIYDKYKITFNESKNINNWYEIYYNLKTSNIIFKEFKEWNIKFSSNFHMNFNNTDYIVIKMLPWLLKINLLEKDDDNKLNIYYKDNTIGWETIINCEFSKTDKSCILNNTGYYENWQIKAILNIKKSSELWEYETLNRFNENWNIQYIENYKNSKLDWEYFEYYENWQIKDEWNYNDWKKILTRTWYYENWNIQYTENYENWELNWEYFEYYENWNIKEEWFYNNWEKTLFWDYYLDDGYNRNYIYYGDKYLTTY